jgi:hypothetical protein
MFLEIDITLVLAIIYLQQLAENQTGNFSNRLS